MKSKILILFIGLLFLSFSCRTFRANDQKKQSEMLEYTVSEAKTDDVSTFKGCVIDLETNKPLKFLNIQIKSLLNSYDVSSDIDGNFKIENIKQGMYKIIFSYFDDEQYIIKETYIEKGKEINIKIKIRFKKIVLFN